MSNWRYLGGRNTMDEVPDGAVGFVYKIEIGDWSYYGLKRFHTKRKVPKGKKELASQDGRASKKKLVIKESNWKNYCSSSDKVKELVSKGHVPDRIVLRVCDSLKELSFYESLHIFNNIQDEHNLNDNVQGKYFKEEIMKWI